MNWPVLFATASVRSRMRAPAAMPSLGTVTYPRRGIIVRTRRGWDPGAIGKRRLIVRQLMTPAIAAGIVAAILGHEAGLQGQTSSHPYRINPNWNKPLGRKIGVASGIRMDRDGRHMWILDRCGANGCAESDLDPIIKMDPDGKIVDELRQGAAQLSARLLHRPRGQRLGDRRRAGRRPPRRSRLQEGHGPPGLEVQRRRQGADATRRGRRGRAPTRSTSTARPASSSPRTATSGSPTGTAARRSDRTATTCTARAAATTGSCGSRRTARSSRRGAAASAPESSDPLRFNDPHDIAIDAEGRLYVADRGNQRVQVLDKEGNFITRWTQFGKPSAIAIDDKGTHLRRRRHVGRPLESRLGARHPRRRPQDGLGEGVHSRHGDAEPAPGRSSSASIRRGPSTRAPAAVRASSCTSSSGRWIDPSPGEDGSSRARGPATKV